ncbi:hypothetical protein SARC_05837 [Sphaeroforma arctica JP610]|uniref:Uncharacterized protein n=1 Tax=Sphaeroforma arctica JP610 TaxID=667725 RepID=A0A0L0FZ06_9EUKA|nr:hypothetical protein SARC_05837 [Sphaeroforma arctica JP610]KNC81864.1 hypothetical protein SARC_05837 [Sphaeroforma arctica JP610]|eukprot:XP_014155766.1 hypothetical protein SARC_05837 [Sphaeroforma arctica JP610]
MLRKYAHVWLLEASAYRTCSPNTQTSYVKWYTTGSNSSNTSLLGCYVGLHREHKRVEDVTKVTRRDRKNQLPSCMIKNGGRIGVDANKQSTNSLFKSLTQRKRIEKQHIGIYNGTEPEKSMGGTDKANKNDASHFHRLASPSHAPRVPIKTQQSIQKHTVVAPKFELDECNTIEIIRKDVLNAGAKEWRVILARLREVFYQDYNRIMCEYIHFLPVVDSREDERYVNGLALQKVLGDVCRVCAKPTRDVLDTAMSSVFRRPKYLTAANITGNCINEEVSVVSGTRLPQEGAGCNQKDTSVHDCVLDFLTAGAVGDKQTSGKQGDTPCIESLETKQNILEIHTQSNESSILGKGLMNRLPSNDENYAPAPLRKQTRNYGQPHEVSNHTTRTPPSANQATTFKFADLSIATLQQAIRIICPESCPRHTRDTATQIAEDEARRHACDELADMGIRARMIFYKLTQTNAMATKLDLHGNYNVPLARALIRRMLRHVGGVPEADYYAEFMESAEMSAARASLACACVPVRPTDLPEIVPSPTVKRVSGNTQVLRRSSTAHEDARDGRGYVYQQSARPSTRDNEYSEVIILHGASRYSSGLRGATRKELARLGMQTKELDEWDWLDKGMTIIPPLEIGKFFNSNGGSRKLQGQRVS